LELEEDMKISTGIAVATTLLVLSGIAVSSTSSYRTIIQEPDNTTVYPHTPVEMASEFEDNFFSDEPALSYEPPCPLIVMR
jgi:hypothetical protein